MSVAAIQQAYRDEVGRKDNVAEPTDALCRDWIAVAAAHSGAGASTVALAVVDALSGSGQPARLIETAPPSRSGLVAAASVELGLDPTGAWRRGSRQQATVLRRASNENPGGWPESLPADRGATTVIDLGSPAIANVARLAADRPAVIVVCRVTVPAVRMAERLLAEIAGAPVVVAAIGPRRWPGEVAASAGPYLSSLRDTRRVAAVPEDARLKTTGPTSSPLPKPVIAAARTVLAAIEDVQPGHRQARSVSRQKGTRSWAPR